jgi:hypothetical protein
MTTSPVTEEATKLIAAAMRRVRGAQPELAEHLAAAASEVSAALRTLFEDPVRDAGHDRDAGRTQQARASSRLEHIDIGE